MAEILEGVDARSGRPRPASDTAESVAAVRGLAVRYPDGTTVSIGGLPFTVAAGERVALLGANGSGKSTLLRALLGLVSEPAGEVRVFGRDPAQEFDVIRPRIGGVLQDVEAQLLAPTVREDLAFGLEGRGLSKGAVRERVEEIAHRFALRPLLDKVPHYLSGGEKRKVALAGALVTEPDLLVLDEPFAGLDPRSRAELVRLLLEAHARRGMAVVLTTHQVQELPALVDAVYLLGSDGTLLVRDTPRAVFGMRDLLADSNVEVPPLTQLTDALRRRGVEVPATEDPEVIADALATRVRGAAPL
ncbi:MAG: energy-coupling factor ABC transporter ATP-binding protein [Chloroflexota bacterium]|nr:energy-coupling factor ABC transporter ATP-binding protein [Chloroflexota bacterium]